MKLPFDSAYIFSFIYFIVSSELLLPAKGAVFMLIYYGNKKWIGFSFSNCVRVCEVEGYIESVCVCVCVHSIQCSLTFISVCV